MDLMCYYSEGYLHFKREQSRCGMGGERSGGRGFVQCQIIRLFSSPNVPQKIGH